MFCGRKPVSPTPGKVPLPTDSALSIPQEEGFEHFKNVTVESLKDVKLYDRYPAPWQVVNLEDTWEGIEFEKGMVDNKEKIGQLAEQLAPSTNDIELDFCEIALQQDPFFERSVMGDPPPIYS